MVQKSCKTTWDYLRNIFPSVHFFSLDLHTTLFPFWIKSNYLDQNLGTSLPSVMPTGAPWRGARTGDVEVGGSIWGSWRCNKNYLLFTFELFPYQLWTGRNSSCRFFPNSRFTRHDMESPFFCYWCLLFTSEFFEQNFNNLDSSFQGIQIKFCWS